MILFDKSLSYFVYVADFLENRIRPEAVAGYLVAAVASGQGSETGDGAVVDADGAALGEDEVPVAFDGVDDGEGIPHLLTCVAVAAEIDLLDGVAVGPRDVGNDQFGKVFDALSHFAGGVNHIDIGGPETYKGLGERYALAEIVACFVGCAEDAALDVMTFHFPTYKFDTAERRDVVALGFEQLGKTADETYAYD